MNITQEVAKLEVKRTRLHEYIIMKLEEKDYHGIADAAMDLRELDARVKALNEIYTAQSYGHGV